MVRKLQKSPRRTCLQTLAGRYLGYGSQNKRSYFLALDARPLRLGKCICDGIIDDVVCLERKFSIISQ